MIIGICDDEPLYCRQVKAYLDGYLKSSLEKFEIYTFYSGQEFLKASIRCDIVFMDIELPDINGFEIVMEYQHICSSKIIFLTSHAEEMANGYRVKAFRFLLKPIDLIKFKEAVDQAILEICSEKKIVVLDGENKKIVKIADIIYIEAADRSTGIRTREGFYKSAFKITEYSNLLDPLFFFQTHRSYIVNMRFISDYNHSTIFLDNGEIVKLSRLKYQMFQKHFFCLIQEESRRR